MRVGLIDLDGHNFPSITLMKISAWHKAKGDSVEWYKPIIHSLGEPFDRVYLSKVFSFSQDFPYYINAKEVFRGGSGYAIKLVEGKEIYNKEADPDLPAEIEHIYPDYSLYPELTNNMAYGFLTRGCPRGCEFCHVAAKEGRCSVKVADLSEFWRGQKRVALCDPNILACPEHIELLEQLADSGAIIEVNQGFDIRLVNDANLELIKKIRLDKIHFAYDRYEDKGIIEPKLRRFAEQTGYDRGKGRAMVYILVNFNTTLEQDIERIQFCRSLNFSPYPMIYNREHALPIYKKLQRWCSNYVFWKVPTFEEYVVQGRR